MKPAQPPGMSLVFGGGGRAPEQGFPAALSEGQAMVGAFYQGRMQMCAAHVQPAAPRAVLQSRVPAAQGLCAGAGTLPPARVITQPAQGAPHGTVGRNCGGKERPPAGQGPSAVERVLCGSGLLTALDLHWTLTEAAFIKEHQSRHSLKGTESVFSVSCSCLSGWRIGHENSALGSGGDT